MIRPALVLSLAVAITVSGAVAPLAAQSASDTGFQLPPAPRSTQDNRVQGPVDSDAPLPGPRPSPPPTATPPPDSDSAPRPATAPAPAPTGRGEARLAAPVTRAAPAETGRTVGESPRAAAAAPGRIPTESAALPASPSPAAVSASNSEPAASATPPAPASSAASDGPAQATQRRALIPWVAGLTALCLAMIPLVVRRFRQRRRRIVPRPPESRPAVGASGTVLKNRSGEVAHTRPEPAPVPLTIPAAIGDAPVLALKVEAIRFDRSVMNATVAYRVTVRNRTSAPLNNVSVEADLASANRDRPAEQQLASPDHPLPPRHAAARLAPGQSIRFEGQVRLPLAEASAVWQGRVGLLVPLLRMRATAAGSAPVVTTLVIGRSEGSGARPQPFRLDETPRSYSPLAQRTLDGAPLIA